MRKIGVRFFGLILLSTLGACASSPDRLVLESPAPQARLAWPLNESHVITSGYGARDGHGPKGDFHRGIDISAPRGTRVLAAASGVVSGVGDANGYGHCILIDHGNGTVTLYAHLLDFAVRRGDRVVAGDCIGRVGKSGNATGYHLHFEVRQGNHTVDPRLYLR